MDVPGGFCFLMRFPFLAGSWQPSLCVFAWGRGSELTDVSSCKNTNAIGSGQDPTLLILFDLNYLHKAISLNIITLGIGGLNKSTLGDARASLTLQVENVLQGVSVTDYIVCGTL